MTACAGEADTSLVSNGTAGPYVLGRGFIDAGSIRVGCADTAMGNLPGFTFDDASNGLYFSRPLPRGASFGVRFRTLLYGLPRTYALFDKAYLCAKDSLQPGFDTLPKNGNDFADENLTVSGFKSINASTNNLGNANLEQALDVSLSGNIGPHTTVSGHITDQGTSLEGATREVADLDMVYLSLVNPRFNALVGDQYVKWLGNGMLSGEKKIKGISGGLTLPHLSLQVFGAISAGQFTVQTTTGISGVQGPYRLTGGGNGGLVTPIQGTVHVSVGGKKLTEGADQDFMVNYELGSVTFTPRILIRDQDIIRMEYEYRTYFYQRTITGMSLSASAPDSSISVQGALWYEGDNKNEPLDLSLSDSDKALLASAKDTSRLRSPGQLIDPKDVAWESAQVPLYTLDSLGHYRYTPFNPNNPANNQGFYYISFRDTAQGSGDYALDSASMTATPALGLIYRYAGAGQGSATLPPVPLPQSTTTGEIMVKAKPASWIALSVDAAGIRKNPNLFYAGSDNQTAGGAVNATAMLGNKRTDRRSLWLGGDYSYTSSGMSAEVSSAFDRNKQWDDTTSATNTGLRQSWESMAGATLAANTFAQASYGQYRHDNELVTDHIEGSAQTAPFKGLRLDYTGDLFRHWTDTTFDKTRRGDGHLNLALNGAALTLEYKDEWRQTSDALNHGSAGAGASLDLPKLSLNESVFYSLFRRGAGGLLGAQDTGRSLEWDQKFSRVFSPAWHASLSSRYFMQDIANNANNTTLLVVAENEFASARKTFSTKQSYQVTIEQASSFVQAPVWVGAGLGAYAWSDSLRQYVPAKNGDYVVQEKEVYGAASEDRLRKARLNAVWSLAKPTKHVSGLLGDLSWSGTLNIDEYIAQSQSLPLSSWVPGYTSLFKPAWLLDSQVSYADIYYRQNLEWNPDSLTGLHGHADVQPFIKKIQDYAENGAQIDASLDRTIKLWLLSAEGAYISVKRQSAAIQDNDTDNNYSVSDQHLQLTEKYRFFRDFSLYLKETGGRASMVYPGNADNGQYYRLVPGLMWQPGRKGSAELSYSYSYVGVPGTLDYRVAQGFSTGATHVVDFNAHINFGAHFSTEITYKGEFGKPSDPKSGLHMLSMQMKAML